MNINMHHPQAASISFCILRTSESFVVRCKECKREIARDSLALGLVVNDSDQEVYLINSEVQLECCGVLRHAPRFISSLEEGRIIIAKLESEIHTEVTLPFTVRKLDTDEYDVTIKQEGSQTKIISEDALLQ